jgi:hypothetical protein
MPSFSLIGVATTLLGGEFRRDPGAEQATLDNSVDARDVVDAAEVELRFRSGRVIVVVAVAAEADVRVGAAMEYCWRYLLDDRRVVECGLRCRMVER